jgi:hypothetical protein
MATLGHCRTDAATAPPQEWEDYVGWGLYEDDGRTQCALWICKPFDGGAPTPGNGTMIALKTTISSADGLSLRCAEVFFMRQRWRTAGAQKARQVCDCTTVTIFTPPTYAIPMEISLQWFIVVDENK